MEFSYCTVSSGLFQRKNCLFILIQIGSTEENGFGEKALDNERTKLLRLWASFYGEDCTIPGSMCFLVLLFFFSFLLPVEPWFPTFDEVKAYVKKNPNCQKFQKIRSNIFFNVPCYKKRIRLTIETFLFEANTRAQGFNQGALSSFTPNPSLKNFAYCHVVGLGLGVWELVCNLILCYYEEITYFLVRVPRNIHD